MKFERGGFALGLVLGLLAGLALALGVALYITKAPVPFMNKVPQRTAEQDAAEAERNKTWNPNAPLAPQLPGVAGGAGSPASGPATALAPPAVPGEPGLPSARDPAAILSGGALSTDPDVAAFTYFVQVGAYTRAADAEAQRAGLAIQGFTARIYEREQAGRTVYRVRLGPFDVKSEADAQQLRLKSAGLDGQLVRVQKS